MMPQGRFLVLEGLEGAGKSTALQTIEHCLAPHVPELVLTREPGGTQAGETIRTLLKNTTDEVLAPRAELLLFYAARVQLLEQVIWPALARGAWVLADRFELSSFAYQAGGRQLDRQFISQLSRFCLADFKADLTLFLDISPTIGLQRAVSRGKIDRIEAESGDFFQAVNAQYQQEIKHYAHVEVVDASLPLDEVQLAIKQIIQTYLKHHVVT